MLDVHLLLAFIAAASLLTMMPGIDTAMVLRAAAVGPKTAALAALGVGAGCLAWGAAASLGLGAVLMASATAFVAIKWIGAIYLIWMGLKQLLRPKAALAEDTGQTPRGGTMPFRRALAANLLNPKVGVFYVTFLPQFIPASTPVAAYSFLLASIHVLLTLAWFAALIAATIPLTKLLQRPNVVRALNRATGAVFIVFGLRLAVSER